MSESSQTSSRLPERKLRGAYAQLEKCLERKKEPPAWLSCLIMRDVCDTEKFQSVSDFQSAEIISDFTAVDYLPVHSDNSAHSSTTPQLTLPLGQYMLPLRQTLTLTSPREIWPFPLETLPFPLLKTNHPLLNTLSLLPLPLLPACTRTLKRRQTVLKFRTNTIPVDTRVHAIWLPSFACRESKAILPHEYEATY